MNLSMGGRWEPADRRGPRLDDPMSWSMPLGRLAGIDVRMHLLLPLFAAVELGRSALGHSALGTGPTAVLLAWLLFSVLLHELGHCFACRRFGGEADEIVLWPLGGLAACRPREDWSGQLATAVGGPIVNLALAMVASLILVAMGAPIVGVAIPNPLDPVAGLVMVGGSTAQGAIFLLAWINVVLLMLNLVPMPPLDGGTIVQALLGRKRGESEATRGAVRIGCVAAVALAIVGMLTNQLLLVGLAVVGGVWCHRTSRRLAAERIDDHELASFETGSESWRDPGPDRPSRSEVRAEREAARAEAAREREQAELDRILEKIQRRGMDGLSPFEKRFLRKVTRRRRET